MLNLFGGANQHVHKTIHISVLVHTIHRQFFLWLAYWIQYILAICTFLMTKYIDNSSWYQYTSNIQNTISGIFRSYLKATEFSYWSSLRSTMVRSKRNEMEWKMSLCCQLEKASISKFNCIRYACAVCVCLCAHV